jgi:hypothetical protein
VSGRIRSIKPEWLEDERLVMLKPGARTLSVALLVLADDQGRGRFVPTVMAARIFPGNPGIFPGSFWDLASVGFVRVYEVDGQRYWEIRNWEKHQRVDKPAKPRVPAPLDGRYLESQDFFLGNPGIPRLTPIPIPIPTSDQDPDLRPGPRPKSRREKSQSDDPTPGAQVRKAFLDGYAARYPNAPAYPWGPKEAGQAKHWLRSVTLAEALDLVRWFFAWKRPEVIKAGHPFGTGGCSLVMKYHELRADLSHPERRAFAAAVNADEQQATHNVEGEAQTARVVAKITGHGDDHDPFRPLAGNGAETLGRNTAVGRGAQQALLGRSDHGLVQEAGGVRERIGSVAGDVGGLRRGSYAEPAPARRADARPAGDEAIPGDAAADPGAEGEG